MKYKYDKYTAKAVLSCFFHFKDIAERSKKERRKGANELILECIIPRYYLHILNQHSFVDVVKVFSSPFAWSPAFNIIPYRLTKCHRYTYTLHTGTL